MMTFSELRGKWDTMPMYTDAFLLLDSTHPVEIHIGYAELNQKTLLIRNAGEQSNVNSSKSIVADNYKTSDGTWNLSFRLIQIDNEEVFLRFCWDIIESSRQECDDPIQFIIERYAKWLKLMEHMRTDIMDASRQKGLIGELLHLIKLTMKLGIEKTVQSWTGPFGSDQDFVYDDTWDEVKSVGVASETVSISSLEQLDTDQNGTLVVYFIDKTTPTNANGISLATTVCSARECVESSTTARELLEQCLFLYGYRDLKEYEVQKYHLAGFRRYNVSEEFPKLIRKNTNSAITQARYSLSLSAIAGFVEGEL